MQIVIQINRFINLVQEAASESHITAILDEFTRWIGFERFAMGHHVDLARPPRNAFRASNYDSEWVHQIIEHRYFMHDPIHLFSNRRHHGFRWDIIDFNGLTKIQRVIMEQARRYGLVAGYTVPVYLPGEYGGTCSFAGPSYDRVCPLTLTLVDSFVTHAFERVRTLMEKRDGRSPRVIPHLEPRHHKTLILAGRGKTDSQIAEILHVTNNTAHKYMEEIRDGYGGLNRPSLMLHAVYDNQFSFADAFWR